MKTRVIVSAVIENSKGEISIGRKPSNQGVYLDAWHLPGGGINKGETLEEGLKREVKEETGLDITDIEPIIFSDGVAMKHKDGETEKVYMIFHDFKCLSKTDNFTPNDDLENLKWVAKSEIKDYNLTPPSKFLFKFLGWI